MASVHEMLFLLTSLGMVLILLAKVYNILKKGEIYDVPMACVLGLAYGCLWLFGLFVLILYPRSLYLVGWLFGGLLLTFVGLLTFIEAIALPLLDANKVFDTYFSNKNRAKR